MEIEFFEARDLPDAWFQCVYRILDSGHVYEIDKGSFQGQKRREFDFVVVQVRYPGTRPSFRTFPPVWESPPLQPWSMWTSICDTGSPTSARKARPIPTGRG